jgi:hypothetical protein
MNRGEGGGMGRDVVGREDEGVSSRNSTFLERRIFLEEELKQR